MERNYLSGNVINNHSWIYALLSIEFTGEPPLILKKMNVETLIKIIIRFYNPDHIDQLTKVSDLNPCVHSCLKS